MLTGGWHFTNETAARAGWEQVRRDVWAQCHRFSIPGSAQHFDALSYDADQAIRFAFNREHCPLNDILEALESDRANLAAFSRTQAAKSIADFLHLLRSDLDEIERTARRMAAWNDGPWWARPYPHGLSSSARYGDVAAGVTVATTETEYDDPEPGRRK